MDHIDNMIPNAFPSTSLFWYHITSILVATWKVSAEKLRVGKLKPLEGNYKNLNKQELFSTFFSLV